MVRKEKVLKRMNAWRYQVLLAIALTGVMLFGWARAVSEGTDGVWPPTGKTEVKQEEYSDFLVYNDSGTSHGEYLDISHDGHRENVTAASVRLIAGDASYANALSISEKPDGVVLNYHPGKVNTNGVGTFLLNMESEHYWESQTLHVRFIDFRDVEINKKQNNVTCLMGDRIRSWDIAPQLFAFGAELSEFTVGVRLEDVTTANYRIENGELTPLKEGDFPVPVTLQLGMSCVEVIGYRFTLHVLSQKAAEEESKSSWPPAGKEEGCLDVTEALAGVYVCHYADSEDVFASNNSRLLNVSPGKKYDYDSQETVMKSHLIFVSGDERLKDAFRVSGAHLEWDGLKYADADGAQATFRLDAESEHYYGSAEFTINTVNFENVTVELTKDVLPAAGKTLNLYEMLQRDLLQVSPEMHYYASLRNEAGDYGEKVETDQYAIEWGNSLTVKQPGQYTLYLYINLGRNNVMIRKPITIDTEMTEAEIEENFIDVEMIKAGIDGDFVETESALFQYGEDFGRMEIKKIIPLKEELVIPAVLDGKKVESIAYYAIDREGVPVISLVIEEGVQIIDGMAFSDQETLKSVWLPDSLALIASNAFYNCPALSEIRLPSAIQMDQIDAGAFRRTGIESLFLPDGTNLMKRSLEMHRRGIDDAVCVSTYAEPFEYLTAGDGSVYIINYSDYYAETVSVPREINGKPVKAIGRKAFADKTQIRKIELPEGLEEIGEMAFYGCTALEEVTIPSTVTVIGSKAFAKVATEAIALPEGVTGAAADWFTGPERTDSTGKWKYLVLPDGTAELSEYEYAETIVFPSQVDGYPVTAIQKINAQNWNDVRKIVLPDTLKVIEEDVFSHMNLTELSLPVGLERIGDRAFYMVKLKRLTLPESLVSIGDEAFAFHEIDELVFPARLKFIGNAAFVSSEDKYPSKVTFKGYSTEIGKGVFGYSYYTSFISVGYKDPSQWQDIYVTDPGWKVDTITLTCYPGSTADQLYQENVKKNYLEWGEDAIRTAPAEKVLQAGLYGEDELIFEVIVPEGVEEIAENAFRGMKALARVSLPSTLKSIGSGAFEECSSLKEITLPERITVIPSDVFKGCTNLSKVNIGKDGLLRIGSNAFRGCKALTDIKLGKRLTEIGAFAFAGTGLKKMVVPDTVTKIGNNAFAASKITSLTLPKGLTEVPEELCYDAVDLKTVTFPKGVVTIGSYAFHNCGLSKLTLPEGLVSIGGCAFIMDEEGVDYHYYWYKGKKPYASLKSLKLPASLESIGENAFACQDALTSISFAKGSKLREIGDGAFRKCLNLKEVKLPDSLESIGRSAFTNCFGLKKADLGGGVKSIGDSAFAKDSNMTDLTVPDSLTGIGKNLLEGHGDKLTVTCGAGSAMEAWLQINAPEITIKHPKQK